MKSFLTIIIAVLLLGLSGYSQQKTDPILTKTDPIVSITKPLTAGDELIKYTNHVNTGYILIGIGYGITYLATKTKPKYSSRNLDDLNKSNRNTCYVIGGLSMLIGTIFLFESHSHIRKAGEKLNLNMTENGIGLVYKL